MEGCEQLLFVCEDGPVLREEGMEGEVHQSILLPRIDWREASDLR